MSYVGLRGILPLRHCTQASRPPPRLLVLLTYSPIDIHPYPVASLISLPLPVLLFDHPSPGESYAGHYVPHLAAAIVDGNKGGSDAKINLQVRGGQGSRVAHKPCRAVWP